MKKKKFKTTNMTKNFVAILLNYYTMISNRIQLT